MSDDFRYRAFISYSHTDEVWAKWLHKSLETYRLPRHLVGRETEFGPVPERLAPIFRDRDELATATSLGETLTRALQQSATQIVICSPAAARSRWVNEEILTYKRLGREHRIFCLIVGGEPGDPQQECFPHALRFQMGVDGELTQTPSEPIAADIRPGKDSKLDGKLKLVAGMLGVGLDELKQREAHRQKVRMTIVVGGSLAGMAITSTLAAAAWFARNEAERQRVIAQQEAETASRTAQFMVGLFKVKDPSEERGNTITAREVLDNGARRIATELDDQPEIQAKLMDTIGSVYEGLGLYAEAGRLLAEALDKRRHEFGDQHADVAQTMAHLAKVLSLQAKYRAAEPMYRVALGIQRQQLGDSAPQVAETLVGLAELLTSEGRFQDAEVPLRESLEIRRRIYGNEHLEVANGLEILGVNLYDQGQNEAAESMLRDAVVMQRRLLHGGDHPDLAESLNNLALLLWDDNKYDEAEALYREALAMSRKLYDELHPTIAVTLNNLALVEHDQGKLDAAEKDFRDVIRLRRQGLGEEHPEVAITMNNLAFVLDDKGDRKAAIAMQREALGMYRRLFPEGHPDLAASLTNLSRWLIDEQDYDEAEAMLLESLAMQRNLLGDDHQRVAVTQTELARLYLSKGRFADGAATSKEARLKLAESLSPDHWRTAWAGVIEGASLTRLKKYAAAEPLLKAGLAVIETSPSAGVLRVQATQKYVAELYNSWDKPDRAAASLTAVGES